MELWGVDWRLGSMKINTSDTPSKKLGRPMRLFVLLLVIMGLPALACSLPALPKIPFVQPPASQNPEVVATPVADTLSFRVPAYAINLDPGETVPGTRLTYTGRAGDDYEVSIDGLSAVKRTGDSFFWSGVVAPGVYANYNLRLTTALFGSLPVAGPVELIVFNPQAVPAAEDGDPQAYLHYGNLVLDTKVAAGNYIPGTTYVYEGVETQGVGDQTNQMARIGGLQNYPYLAVGDSLEWMGQLRDNVMVRYKLRVISYDERAIFLVGTGDLWILN